MHYLKTPGAYFNEFDPKAAAWLRELIKQGHIAPGDVDERSIEDVRPDDLRGYAQCHFFAGIGVWSFALRRAGWADDRPVWTGSCPCQPFSAAGKGGGFDDERHLWPAFHHLIRECGPGIVFGEQVASKDGLGWLDLVSADLEGSGYASGAVDLCAAGVGAPHIRQRLWWVGERLEHPAGDGRQQWRAEPSGRGVASGCGLVGLADADDTRPQGRIGVPERASERAAGASSLGGGLADADHAERRPDATGGHDSDGQDAGRAQGASDVEGRGGVIGLADAERSERGTLGLRGLREVRGAESGGAAAELAGSGGDSGPERTRPVDGFWRDADWLFCRDGKWRPTKSGIFPLAHGYPERVGLLRGAGNAIVAPAAQAFIEAYEESRADRRFRLNTTSALPQDMDIFG